MNRPLGKNEIGKFLKDAFAAAKLDDTNKKKVSNNSVRETSVGQLLEADVPPNSLRSVCTGDLGQDSPIKTSLSVNKSLLFLLFDLLVVAVVVVFVVIQK